MFLFSSVAKERLEMGSERGMLCSEGATGRIQTLSLLWQGHMSYTVSPAYLNAEEHNNRT